MNSMIIIVWYPKVSEENGGEERRKGRNMVVEKPYQQLSSFFQVMAGQSENS
uniref:Uncharacterized protein n=1 Tax=Nelumbo nucifera TaxID=4432 RepID=A0A822YA01_NELNU|nr:TPA_asm: hypothetical protein HUJ06_030620 [Nelumbo nucifera]